MDRAQGKVTWQSAERLKLLRTHHAALTHHEHILEGHARKGSTLIGEEEATPILEELGRLKRNFPDLVPDFSDPTQTFPERTERYRNTSGLRAHLGSVLARLAIEITEETRPEVATRDAVTQLRDKGAFTAALTHAVDEATREHPLSLVFGDIDHFKSVNDRHGHPVGDVVLLQVARALERVAQEKGNVYRWGGEEFAVILRNHSAEEALAMAERARREIERRLINGLSVTMGFGVACFPDDAANVDSLTDAADKAMYDAKNRGRNLVRRFGEPPPTGTGPRQPDRKLAMHGRLTDTQRRELRGRHLRGERIRCPEDQALLRVTDVSTMDSGGRLQFAIHCPDCDLSDLLQG